MLYKVEHLQKINKITFYVLPYYMTYFGNDVWMINVLDFSDKVKTEAKGIFGQNEKYRLQFC